MMPVPRCVRALVVRALDATVDACFRASGRILAWRDALDPPPAPSPLLVNQVMVRIAAEAPGVRYVPTAIDREAAWMANDVGRSLYLLMDSHGVPAYVFDTNFGPCQRQVPPS